MKEVPVVPAKSKIFGNTKEILANPLEFFTSHADPYGDIYNPNTMFRRYYILRHPDYIKHVLVSNKNNYVKNEDYKVLEISLGKGLLTSEGEFWKRQRRIAQPAFYKDALKGFLTTMQEKTNLFKKTWETSKPLDISTAMMTLTLEIVTDCLFSSTIEEKEYSDIQEAISLGNHFLSDRMSRPISLPLWFPTKSHREFAKSQKITNDVLFRIIHSRQAQKEEERPSDLLSMLLAAKDEETGERMTAKQLRDEVVTLFVAGHETTANTLAWAFYLLACHPDKQKILKQEVEDVLQGKSSISFEQLRNLNYTEQVIHESMRMYPPAWGIIRKSVEEDEVNNYKIPKHTQMLINIFAMHRHPDFWENPDSFSPERFHPDLKKKINKYAYIPFGAGQRMCIGHNFAMMEMKIVLALIAQSYTFGISSDAKKVELEPLVTLRPKEPILLEIS